MAFDKSSFDLDVPCQGLDGSRKDLPHHSDELKYLYEKPLKDHWDCMLLRELQKFPQCPNPIKERRSKEMFNLISMHKIWWKVCDIDLKWLYVVNLGDNQFCKIRCFLCGGKDAVGPPGAKLACHRGCWNLIAHDEFQPMWDQFTLANIMSMPKETVLKDASSKVAFIEMMVVRYWQDNFDMCSNYRFVDARLKAGVCLSKWRCEFEQYWKDYQLGHICSKQPALVPKEQLFPRKKGHCRADLEEKETYTGELVDRQPDTGDTQWGYMPCDDEAELMREQDEEYYVSKLTSSKVVNKHN